LISAWASTAAPTSTSACEMTVNQNVFQSAARKIGLCHSFEKLRRPMKWPVSEPEVASVKLR